MPISTGARVRRVTLQSARAQAIRLNRSLQVASPATLLTHPPMDVGFRLQAPPATNPRLPRTQSGGMPTRGIPGQRFGRLLPSQFDPRAARQQTTRDLFGTHLETNRRRVAGNVQPPSGVKASAIPVAASSPRVGNKRTLTNADLLLVGLVVLVVPM